jgi:hypothetical protein
MELYILDPLLRRVEVVDMFESLIWTERFRATGDFEVNLHSTNESRKLFTAGTLVGMNESYRVMKVETLEDTHDEQGKMVLKVSGRSLENILEDRAAKDTMSNTTTEPTWNLTGTAANVARQIFNDICVLGQLNAGDKIPLVQIGAASLFPINTIPEDPTVISVKLELQTVYAAIKGLCDLYDLGFRLTTDLYSTVLRFEIYAGSDRTSTQFTLPPVVFSPNLDNLQNTTELKSIEPNKNVAYVFSPVGFEIVYASGVDPEVESLDRQVLLVNATDITDTNPATASALMIQRGREELTKNRGFSAFDGELNHNSTYKYGRDYQLGDLVEMRNIDGLTNNMRVTEQIFASDAEGDRSYPTLAIDLVIEPGSWLAWEHNQVWLDLDLDTTSVWANQP